MIARSGQVDAHRLEPFVVPLEREQHLEVCILDDIRHQPRQVDLQRGYELALDDLAVGGHLLFGDLDRVVLGHELGAGRPVRDDLPEGE